MSLEGIDSIDSIREEMLEAVWERVDPPLWWPAASAYIVGDGGLGSLRAHMVLGHVEPGVVVNNAHVIGQDDWPDARFSDVPSHLKALPRAG